MRKILAIATLLVSGSAFAGACEDRADLAREVMASRQAGVPIADVIRLAKESNAYTKATRDLILRAYEAPRYQTEEHQQREITEFENAAYVACARKGA